CLLDYGVRFREEERLPLETDLDNLKAVALTHCHIDHSGALPYLYRNGKVPLFTNPVSMAITRILIKDMIRISHYPYPFGYKELNKLMRNSHFLKNGYRQKIASNFFITFFNAGHIPGSVSILVEVDNKKILYTGDINTRSTNLVKSNLLPNASNIPDLDALITESTYTLRNHPQRSEIEHDFVDRISNATENGGRVLVPAFGVARSQEALLILQKYQFSGKVYIDGLAKKVSHLYLDYPESINNYSEYKKALKRAKFINNRKVRNIARNSNGVIIAPSGMLKGGAAFEFVRSVLNDPLSAIYLVGYQVEGTPGKNLIDKGSIEFKSTNRGVKLKENISIKAKCDYDYFDFSSHADGDEMQKYIHNLSFHSGNKDVFCIHGDPEATIKLSSILAHEGYNAVAPEVGETYYI
ncbi:MAG: MBL fold metallo-hydrolase, partial [Promethearchaeota archaeon]